MNRIREAQEEDIPSIIELSAGLGYDDTPPDIAYKRILKILTSETDQLWVFEENHQLKGWIHLFTAKRVASPPFAEIGGLVVSSTSRREGIGKQLVSHANQWAQKHDLKLRVRVNEKRISACEFYRSIGFSDLKSQVVFEIGS